MSISRCKPVLTSFFQNLCFLKHIQSYRIIAFSASIDRRIRCYMHQQGLEMWSLSAFSWATEWRQFVCLFVCFPISQRRRCEWICLRWILAMPRELHLCTLHPRLLRSLGCGEELISCYEPKIAMASNLLAMASNLIAMASNLIAMASM